MSLLAEQQVIGALLIDARCMNDIYKVLEPEMFTSALLGRIYLEYARGFDRNEVVTLPVLEQRIASDAFPPDMLMKEIAACMTMTATSAGVKENANAVVSAYKADRAKKIISAVNLSPSTVNEQIGAIIGELEALQEGRSATSKSLSDITKENKVRYGNEEDVDRLYIGFSKLDECLGGLEGGDMIVIGARPAVGKSAFVTQVATHFSSIGKRVGFYNLEMQEKQMYERFVSSESKIGISRIKRAKKFNEDEQARFDRANEFLEKRDNIVISTGSKSMRDIKAESRHMNYDVIIIDYLQLLRADTTYRGNRYAEVGQISLAIKALAMELNIPIIALSQLNRVSEASETKEPSMADLRESGSIEQDASVVILLWNLSKDDHSKKGCKIEKNRQGNLTKVVMKFNGDEMRFEETNEDVNEASEWVRGSYEETPFDC